MQAYSDRKPICSQYSPYIVAEYVKGASSTQLPSAVKVSTFQPRSLLPLKMICYLSTEVFRKDLSFPLSLFKKRLKQKLLSHCSDRQSDFLV